MGAKFHRGADKGKKFRKRFSQTRSWFRTLKWVAYHAHPTMVAGHPFKGSWVFSTGQLLHPDLKRFNLNTAVLFKPPFPGKNPYDHPHVPAVPSFTDFFSSYFGQTTLNINNERCSKMFDSMKKVGISPKGCTHVRMEEILLIVSKLTS
jgi:hypothetical protein